MKNIKIIFALFAFTIIILSFGCSKTEVADNFDYIENAGIIHNQLLDNYYQNRINTAPDLDELISEVINLSSDFLLAEGYEDETVMNTKLLLKEKYRPGNLKSVMGVDFSIDVEKLSAQFNDMDLFSPGFISEVEKVLTMVIDETDIEVVSEYVNSNFAGLKFEDNNDQDGQLLFVNIFNGSYDYWTDDSNSSLKGVQLKPSSWVIINDGIGGLLGLVFGPAGSVITGTIFSLGTNEEIK